MLIDRTKELPVARSIAKRSVGHPRMGMGLAFATVLFLAAPRSAFADEAPWPAPPPKYHSNAQRIAGGVLIGVGAVSLVGSGVAAVVAIENSRSDGAIVVLALVALPLFVQGLVVEAVGIPLYLNGSKPATSANSGAHSPAPMALSLGVGPQSASLKLTF